MRKFLAFFMLGIFLGAVLNLNLAGATSLKHNWRNYFSYKSWYMEEGLWIKKMVQYKSKIFVLYSVLNSLYNIENYIVSFNNFGKIVSNIQVPLLDSNYEFSDMVLDSEDRIFLAGTTIDHQACLVILAKSGRLLSNIILREGEAQGLCLGNMGEVYVAGVTSRSGIEQLQGNKWRSVFVAKLCDLFESDDYKLSWIAYLGSDSYNTGIVLGKTGNLLVGGSSNQTWGWPLSPFQGSKDAFIAELDVNGQILWSTFLGGLGQDVFQEIVHDENGNIAVLGLSSTSWGNPVQPFNAAEWEGNVFVAYLDGTGQLLWNTFLNGTPGGITLDTNGNIFITGCSDDWGKPLWNFKFKENWDYYVAKLNRQGILVWHAFLPPKRPVSKEYEDYFIDEMFTENITFWQGSVFIAGTVGWFAGDPPGGEIFAFLDKITEKPIR